MGSRFSAILLVALLLPALLTPQENSKPEAHNKAPRRLLVIAVSGLDERFLNEPSSLVKIPNIRKMMRGAAVASGVVGVAPSNAVASETSLATGADPEQNGVIADETPASVPRTMPLWQAASNAGLRTATIFWPVTTGAAVAVDFPEDPAVHSGQDVLFENVARHVTPAGLIDRIETASPGFEKQLWDDKSATRATTWLLANDPLDLLMVQLTDVDSEERETGAVSIYARDALENDDELIGQILGAVRPGMAVALVSGHGFENQNYVFRPRVLLRQSGPPPAPNDIEVRDGLIGTRNPKIADRLRTLLKTPHRYGLAREIPMSEVKSKAPDLGRWVAAFDTTPNTVASDEDHGLVLGRGSHHGTGGMWPSRPGYRSVFVLSAEGVRPRRLGEINLLQIAPTLADVIGVKLPQARMHSLWPLISQ